jgi:Tol biopolymer transport system component
MHRFAAICAIAFHLLSSLDLAAQALPHRVSVGVNGSDPDSLSLEPALSESGRIVAFQSYASNLVPNDSNGCADIFVRDRRTGVTTRVSVSSNGAEANYWSGEPAISPDGRFVTFVSEATNLAAGDANGVADVFVHDCLTGRTQRVSISSAGFEGNAPSGRPSISKDGRHVAFASLASNLVGDDKNGVQDVFVRDRMDGSTSRVTGAAAEPDGESGAPSLSADGRLVAFASRSSTFAPKTGSRSEVFVFDVRARKFALASAGSSGLPGGGEAPSISRDGSVVVFESAGRLLAADTNSDRDVYAFRVASRELVLASVSSAGTSGHGWTSKPEAAAPQQIPGDSLAPSVSGDGRFVVFVSLARGLVPGAVSGAEVYLRDLSSGTTRCLSAPDSGRAGASPCAFDPVLGVVDCPGMRVSISANGTAVVFQTRGSLATGDGNDCDDVYVVGVNPVKG